MMYSIHHIHISCLALHISLWILPIQYGIAADFLYRVKTDDAICVFDITSFHRQVEHTHIRQKHTRKRKQSSNRNPFCLSDYEQFARRTYLYMKKQTAALRVQVICACRDMSESTIVRLAIKVSQSDGNDSTSSSVFDGAMASAWKVLLSQQQQKKPFSQQQLKGKTFKPTMSIEHSRSLLSPWCNRPRRLSRSRFPVCDDDSQHRRNNNNTNNNFVESIVGRVTCSDIKLWLFANVKRQTKQLNVAENVQKKTKKEKLNSREFQFRYPMGGNWPICLMPKITFLTGCWFCVCDTMILIVLWYCDWGWNGAICWNRFRTSSHSSRAYDKHTTICNVRRTCVGLPVRCHHKIVSGFHNMSAHKERIEYRYQQPLPPVWTESIRPMKAHNECQRNWSQKYIQQFQAINSFYVGLCYYW